MSSNLPLYSVLDGSCSARNSQPVELEYCYTFTPFECAKGYVSFRKGFELPVGSSIVLGINQPVRGVIHLNGGTIILQDDLVLGTDAAFMGDGNIQTNGHNVIIRSDTTLYGTLTIDGQGIQPTKMRKIETYTLSSQ